MRVISQWRADRNAWGIALFCVFGGREFFGFSVLGVLFEWERKPRHRLPAELLGEWQNDFEFLRGKKWK